MMSSSKVPDTGSSLDFLQKVKAGEGKWCAAILRIRRWIIWLVSSPNSQFETFVLAMIVLNSIVMASTDYRHVDQDYQPTAEGSERNEFVEKSEILFNIVFIIECFFKIVTYGFLLDKDSYLRRNNWNKMDFIVVAASVMGMFPGMPNISVLRTIRVLRPLRSISRLPGLRKIIGALIDSMESLMNVILLLVFFLACFSIIGVVFWRGILHSRCRLTPYPVVLFDNCRSQSEQCWEMYLAEVISNPSAYRCLEEETNDSSWTQSTSPWYVKGPQDCIWPIDTNDERVCNLGGVGGYACPSILAEDGKMVDRTCGSNYDDFGNARFINSMEPYGYPRMESGVFTEGLNWGYTNYDNFWAAFVTTFQVVSMEGWTDVMYQTMDAWAAAPSIVIFIIIVIFGGHIVLNLVLAVITESMEKLEEEEKEANNLRTEAESRLSIKDGSMAKPTDQQQIDEPVCKAANILVKSSFFQTFVMVCIFINTIILACDHYGITDEFSAFLEIVNIVLTFIFFLEMCLSLAGLGMRMYLSNPFSIFDAFIVITSLVELGLVFSASDRKEAGGLSALRALRLFRIFKMAKNWKSIHALLETMYETVLEVGNFTLLLLLMMYIYALVGMQFFANRMHFDSGTGAAIQIGESGYENADIPRSNFDSLVWSMTTVFQILTGENWNSVMYDGRRATSGAAVLYFLSLVVFGVFIVMNLFLAILIGNFQDNEDILTKRPPKQWNKALGVMKVGILKKSKVAIDPDEIQCEHVTVCSDSGFKIGLLQSKESIGGSEIQDAKTDASKSTMFVYIASTCIYCCRSMRTHSCNLVRHPKFDTIITCFIVTSSICLALDNPLSDPNAILSRVLSIFDMIFTIIFFGEMVTKIAAFGFIKPHNAYLKNPWNVLDFVIVQVSILDLAKIGPGKGLRALRTLRVIRPLRMIGRFPELKLVVDALLKSVPAVANVAIICTLFFLIFAIFGVSYLKGTFYACSGPMFDSLSVDQNAYLVDPRKWGDLSTEETAWFDNANSDTCESASWDIATIPTSEQICNCLAPGEWSEVTPQNFNNVFSAMALLFEISTTEGWVDVMLAAVDQRGIGAQPVRDHNLLWIPFFVLFLVIGAFLVLELFVGVIIEQFNNIRNVHGRVLMTKAQQEWAATQAFVLKIRPERRIKRPTGRVRQLCYDFIMPGINPKFDQCILLCIVLNSICMAVTEFGDSDDKSMVLEALNRVFAAIFAAEAITKLIALRARYFDDGWNKFDFGIVVGTIIGQIIGFFTSSIGVITSTINLFRICRLLRLIKSIKKLRLLFNTLLTSIPSMANIGALLFLLFFIYAACGVQLFSMMALNDDMNEQANFQSFGNAMLLLLRFSTGENWNGFMRNMDKDKDGCDPTPEFNTTSPWCLNESDYPNCTEVNGCGGGFILYVYFYSFTLLVSFVILNLFVGVVLDAFDNSAEGDILSPSDLEKFTSVWSEYDPDATWYISTDNLQQFVRELDPPLGLGNASEVSICGSFDEVLREAGLWDVPVNDDGMVNIVHVATHLAKRIAKLKQGDDFDDMIDEENDRSLSFRSRLTLSSINTSKKTLRDIVNKTQKQSTAPLIFQRIIELSKQGGAG
uniref:EF-hand domain-containing protein n=1 Tax=Leptocylindrus danicus TaxID=163516 RepID=A0A7S2PB29_9STRA|mmetsp:Transcript_28040/g.41303  ORF Transcript_28040/g.41303 Transcript_28040/m.41303 type:complete len:1596 (+) Transcript_28040:145-4932(+)